MSPILIVLLNTNCKLRCRSPTLNVNPLLFVIPYNYLGGLTELQCCKYYHLPSKIMPKLLHAFYCQNLVHITLICNDARVYLYWWTNFYMRLLAWCNIMSYMFGLCKYLQSGFSSKFQSSMTIFHRKLLTRNGRVLANELIHRPWQYLFTCS